MTDKTYEEWGDTNKCPYCDSEDIAEYDVCDVDAGLEYKWMCESCQQNWVQVYKYLGILRRYTSDSL